MSIKEGTHLQFIVRATVFGSLLAVVGIVLMMVITIGKYLQGSYELPQDSNTVRTSTPPMGWNSWNAFHCSPDFNENSIKENIDRMVADGYLAAGYRYVVLDDCWQSSRDKSGVIQVDQNRFPSGIKALSEYAHQRGLLFGIYTSAGRETCEGKPGSYGYEQQDLNKYIDWKVDFIKLDWCGVEYLNTTQVYGKWRKLIDQSQKPIVLSVAVAQIYSAFDGQSWLWGDTVGDMWRVATDIQDDWSEMLRVYDINSRYAPYQKVGEWNDADMLEVGNGGMTFTEYRTHFGLWSIMSSPLMLGTDLRALSPELKNLVTNPDAIAINQDKLGLQGEVILERGTIQVISKPLAKRGSRAVLIVNRGEAAAEFTLRPRRLRLLPLIYFKEIWPNNRDRVIIGQYQVKIPPHDSVFATVQGIDSHSELRALLPKLDNQVRSGNLTRQTAFDVYGIFEYDDEFQRGESIGIRNNSSIRYHLNNQCQRLQASFEYVRSERSRNQSESLTAAVYLDGDKVWEYQATPGSPAAQLNLSLKKTRILDLVTHASTTENVILYGRWKLPIIECQD